jgi:C-terminal processing protease CtpA/Prc
MQTLGKTPGFPEAIVRYVECKSLLGGVTTSQGITLANSSLTQKVFHGMIRNVEETGEEILPEALTRIADVVPGGAPAFKASLSDTKTRLLHLAEGVDERARSFFTNLKINEDEWAISNKLNGIHCTGLEPEDYKVLGLHGGSMTWSPMSNLVLYGGTAHIKAARENGIMICLGSDWSPSGSKNLLEELKVAYLVNENQYDAPVFTNLELVRMVTSNPARILGWDKALGSLEVGMKADMLIVNGYTGDPYLKLIQATERSLLGIPISGVPRCSQARFMKYFPFDTPDIEIIKIDNFTRCLYLLESDPDNILQGISLKEASDKISEGLQTLDQLAGILENAHGNAFLSASDNPLHLEWMLVPDPHAEGDTPLEEGHLEWGGGIAFSEIAEPLPIDKLTVIEDNEHFRRMAYHPLPEYIRKGLPAFYNRSSLALSDSHYTVEGLKSTSIEEPVTLATFLKSSSNLSVSDKLCILNQARIILEEVYVHQVLKRSMYAVNPVNKLNLMIRNIKNDARYAPDSLDDDHSFHNELLEIFSSLRDLHTKYILPRPFKNRFAFLPFLIEEYYPTPFDNDPKYIITTYFEDILAKKSGFRTGLEVLYWNNIPIKKAIGLNSRNQSGSNNEARRARGLDTLTIRSLGTSNPPDEHMVRLGCYDPVTRTNLEMEFEWLVTHHPPHFDLDIQEINATMMSYGFDYDTLSVNGLKSALYGGSSRKGKPKKSGSWIRPSHFPDLMKAKAIRVRDSDLYCGYIRIYSFAASDAQRFIDDFKELLGVLNEDDITGLILDIRGNGGGLITASELLLANLAGEPIELQKAQFINSELTLQLCEKYAKKNDTIDLSEWIRSINLSKVTGDLYSRGYPITRLGNGEIFSKIFPKPKILITDALCYSAADMFAAGFQDYGLGKIIGTHSNTGAGGANVWSHEILRSLLEGQEVGNLGLAPLPKGANMSVAVRRILRKNDEPIEDLGIAPDVLHKITKNDLLLGNTDLIRKAMEVLFPTDLPLQEEPVLVEN